MCWDLDLRQNKSVSVLAGKPRGTQLATGNFAQLDEAPGS